MQAFGYFFSAMGDLMTSPQHLLLMAAFTALGILFGALPGISVNMSLILALPLTYSMDTITAMSVLLACYVGAMSGGLISAILLNIPGTGSSICTTFDGHPMAQKGEGGRAVGIGILTSFVGGGLSFIMLMFIAPLIATVALKFGAWEYFAIGIFSVSMIIGVAGDDVIKGVLASLLGMCIAMTGTAPVSSVIRYNFGLHTLDGGITTTALMCGMFAVPELLKLAKNRDKDDISVMKFNDFRGFGISVSEYLSHWKCIIRSALIGAYTGLLPGIGGSSASLLSYLTAKSRSKHPEEYGEGSVEGLISSETANNACIGGAMIPLLALGVPGSSSAAIVLSALTLHGIQCGPLAFTQNPQLIYTIFAILIVSNVFMLVFERGVLKGYIKILSAPRTIIMVMVIMMCFVGSYGARNNFTDLFVFAIGGAIGYVLQNAGFARAPIILGYILSGIVEENLLKGMSLNKGNFASILQHPIAMIFLVIGILYFAWCVRKTILAQRKRAEA